MNYFGRASNLRFENKKVPCPAVPSLKTMCLVFLIDLNLSKIPLYAFQKDILFLRPKQKTSNDAGGSW